MRWYERPSVEPGVCAKWTSVGEGREEKIALFTTKEGAQDFCFSPPSFSLTSKNQRQMAESEGGNRAELGPIS